MFSTLNKNKLHNLPRILNNSSNQNESNWPATKNEGKETKSVVCTLKTAQTDRTCPPYELKKVSIITEAADVQWVDSLLL